MEVPLRLDDDAFFLTGEGERDTLSFVLPACPCAVSRISRGRALIIELTLSSSDSRGGGKEVSFLAFTSDEADAVRIWYSLDGGCLVGSPESRLPRVF